MQNLPVKSSGSRRWLKNVALLSSVLSLTLYWCTVIVPRIEAFSRGKGAIALNKITNLHLLSKGKKKRRKPAYVHAVIKVLIISNLVVKKSASSYLPPPVRFM